MVFRGILLYRTHTCGELTEKHSGKRAKLCGWVSNRRDHGSLIFIDLRDRYGITQVVFNPKESKDAHKIAESLRAEYVACVEGVVGKRPKDTENKELSTGKIEVAAQRLEILNEAKPPPIELSAKTLANEDVRLKYRFVDLRRHALQKNLEFRHRIIKSIRDYFDKQGFWEIETPILAKSTPEGARDYIVPVRTAPGKFFALPQSPQLFKQLLMVGGLDRYFQIAKCCRDEDLRADRQPEFTQLDVEMSFIDENDIFAVVEGCVQQFMKDALGVKIKIPFPRMTHKEAIMRFGLDKPDTRFGMELVDLTNELRGCTFNIFKESVASGKVIKAVVAEGCANYNPKQIDNLTKFVQVYKAKGLVSIKVLEKGKIESSIQKHLSETDVNAIIAKAKAKQGDLVLIIADKMQVASTALGYLRNHLAKELNLAKQDAYNFLWVMEFPFFEFSEEQQKYVPAHHPFTYPFIEDIPKLRTKPEECRSRAYDIVLNGVELGSGSIRIHKSDVQAKVFDALGLSKEEVQQKFGFLLDAFQYGAPPHGGIALGLDRLVAILANAESIRDVIAFPKNKHGVAMMEGAPSEISREQLKEAHISVVLPEEMLLKKEK